MVMTSGPALPVSGAANPPLTLAVPTPVGSSAEGDCRRPILPNAPLVVEASPSAAAPDSNATSARMDSGGPSAVPAPQSSSVYVFPMTVDASHMNILIGFSWKLPTTRMVSVAGSKRRPGSRRLAAIFSQRLRTCPLRALEICTSTVAQTVRDRPGFALPALSGRQSSYATHIRT